MPNQETSITIRAIDKASYAVLGVAAKFETLNKKMASVSQAGYAFGQLSQQLAPLSNRLSNIGSKWGAASRRITGVGLAIGGVAAGLIGFAKSTTDVGDHINDLSDRYLVSGEAIQLYGKMVAESGGSFDDAAVGIGKLKRAMHGALNGDQESRNAFAGIGISVKDLAKLKPEEVLTRMADAFSAHKGQEKSAAKQAILLQLMGKNGELFMQTMNAGGDKIKKTYAEMNKNGEILDKRQRAIAGSFSDSWDRMVGTLDGLKNKVGINLAENLQPQLDRFQNWLGGEGGKQIQAQFKSIFTTKNIDILVSGLKGVWHVAKDLAKTFRWMVEALGPTTTAFIGLGVALAPVGVALASTAKFMWDAGKAVMFIGGNIPGVASGLASIGGAARLAIGGVKAFGIAASVAFAPVVIAAAAALAAFKAFEAYKRLNDTQEQFGKDNAVRQKKREAYSVLFRSIGGDKFADAYGPNTDFQTLNTVASGLERGGQVAPGTAARLAAMPVDVSGTMKIEVSAAPGTTARVTELKKGGRLDFESSTGPMMQGF